MYIYIYIYNIIYIYINTIYNMCNIYKHVYKFRCILNKLLAATIQVGLFFKTTIAVSDTENVWPSLARNF